MIEKLKQILNENGNKISADFINELAKKGTVTYHKLTSNTRVCVITLHNGHEVVGIAQVLDETNDVEEIGNKVAYNNAVNEIWKIAGSIAKLILTGEIK